MANRRVGMAHSVKKLTQRLTTFRLSPESGSHFPEYIAGQYVALSRDDCTLTHRTGTDSSGRPVFVPDVDEGGRHRIGTVTHPYSIASAPFETAAEGDLEFFVTLEIDAHGLHGRLSELLLAMTPTDRCEIHYLDRITGSFTVEHRAGDFQHVVMVGSGTGVAPFVSIVKQAHFVATGGRADQRRYTLFYGNRTRAELAYHDELARIEQAGAIDLTYVPTVSRPPGPIAGDNDLGRGRANNVLRLALGLPTEAADPALENGSSAGQHPADSVQADVVAPVLPGHLAVKELGRRLTAPGTMVLVCGNPNATADVQRVLGRLNIPCEAEDW